jgi:hypothetical protein
MLEQTYKIQTSPFTGVDLQTAQKRLSNWAVRYSCLLSRPSHPSRQAVAPPEHINSTGSNQPGATRTWITSDSRITQLDPQTGMSCWSSWGTAHRAKTL